ncbi:MAG: hypothetical protein M3P53_10565 [Actinomycetota bacterium]|nr:hypothetical protein [Actinomycetota bacterium]
MAKKRQPSREELEREAAAELERSMQRSRMQQSPYPSPPSSYGAQQSAPPPPPAWEPPDTDPGSSARYWEAPRLSAAEEEEAVTELALQQLAERWGGGGSIEDHVMTRMHPSQAEEARDRALREAIARQARFAKPVRRVPISQPTTRGFAGTWTSTSPPAETTEPMAWEADIPSAAPAPPEPAKKRAPNRSAAKEEGPARKKASATRAAPAKRTTAGTRAAPAKKAAARKSTAAKKATPPRRPPGTKVTPTTQATGPDAGGRRSR